MPNLDSITTDDMKSLVENQGWTPEAAAMLARFVAAGMDPSLAAIAVKDYMGLNVKPLTPEQEWDKFERESPIRANTKKLMIKAGKWERALVDKVKEPIQALRPEYLEKVSAAKMLKDYIQMQDAQRANQAHKEGLWMVARMPGAPLAGQPIYPGPSLEGPIAPMTSGATPEQAAANNRYFAQNVRTNWK